MKKQLCFAGVTIALVGGAFVFLSQPAAATKYQANTDTLESPFVITSVQPSTSRITVRYNGEKDDFQPLSLINLEAINVERGATEDQIDEALPSMGKATPYWNYLIYYEQTYDYDERLDYDSTEKEITKSRYAREIDLDQETLHILYYSVRPGSFTSERYIYGKIDYSLCMKSAVYRPEVECRAENKPQGGIWYWPYYNGERLKIPREEWDAWGYHEDEPQPEPTPMPQPTYTPQPTEVDGIDIQKRDNEITPRVAVAIPAVTENTQQQPDVALIPQATRETVEVPVSGDMCPTQSFPWWLVILCIILLGVEGAGLYWWFNRKH